MAKVRQKCPLGIEMDGKNMTDVSGNGARSVTKVN